MQYAVFLPLKDINNHRRPCQQGAKTAKVRAILSWQVPPPQGDPDYVPTWGNREETLAHITPGPKVGDERVPFLSSVGDIPEVDINAAGLGNGSAIHTGFSAVDSPFGGRITLAGHIANSVPGLKYRVMRKLNRRPDTTYTPLTNEPIGLGLTINTWSSGTGWVQTPMTFHADANGYYPYQDFSSTHSVEGSIMGVWFSTTAEDGKAFDLRVDLSVDGNPAHDVPSNVVTALVDNTPPVADLTIAAAAGGDCADFDAGATLTGTFTATDPHFGGFSFVVRPPGPAHGVLPSPASGSYPTISAPGVTSGAWTLNSTGMDPCGYSLTVSVADRTNVGSGAGNNTNEHSVGFCLRKKAAPVAASTSRGAGPVSGHAAPATGHETVHKSDR